MASIGTALGARRGRTTLFAWPPTEEAINRHGRLGFFAAAAGTVACVYYTLRVKEESHTPPILRRRSAASITKSRSNPKVGSDASPAKEPEPVADDKAKDEAEEWKEIEMEVRRPKLVQLSALAEQSWEATKGTEKACTVRFKELLEACMDVRSIDPKCPDLPKGFLMAAKVLVKELVYTTKLTREGSSALHKTGEDVADLIARYSTLHAMCRGLAGDKGELKQLWVEMRELYWQSWYSQFMLWRMRIPDVVKSFKIVFLAKKYVPLLLMGSLLKVTANAIGALDTLYKADALELLRKPDFTRQQLMKKFKVIIILVATKTFVTMIGDRVNIMAILRLHHRLRTEVYSAMMRQDLEWYRLGQQDQRDVHGLFGQIFALPTLSETFINAILRTLETSSDVYFTGTLIQQRSTGLLFVVVSSKFLMNSARTVLDIALKLGSEIVSRTMSKLEINWAEPLMPENITTVRSCAAEPKVLQNWNMFFRMEHDKLSFTDLVTKIGPPANWLIASCGSWVELGTAARLMKEGKIPYAADVQSVNDLATNTGHTLYAAAWSVMAIKEAIPKLARTYELIYTQPSIGLEGGIVPPHSRVKGRVEFRNVSFEYPGTGEVIKDVSFEVPVQSSLGITGSSGAGKSTILLLIQRLYDPKEGQVLFDGVDIKTLNPVWVRRQIAVVSQRPRIFHTSLLDNLRYGCELDPTEEEVQEACKASRLYEVIFHNPVRFPLGIHTRVSNETLSGGELQRVAVARALLQDSPILLLDEATSALDSESQSEVKEGIRNLMQGRTVITVAHRLETIKDSDAIMCIEDGTVRERGSHQELVQSGGLYSRLYREQIESTISGMGGAVAPEAPAAAEPAKEEEGADAGE